jgi:DNA-binding MarR family transcriptional regulator
MASADRKSAKDSLVGEIIDLFHQIGAARGKATASAWMDLKLTLPQFKVLVVISQHEISTVGCIADQLGVGESAASYLVERLARAELVERAEDPSDRRKAMIRLSDAGRALLEQLLGPRNWLKDRLHDIDIEELEALRRGLEAVLPKPRKATRQHK